jgi:hypothetical protein
MKESSATIIKLLILLLISISVAAQNPQPSTTPKDQKPTNKTLTKIVPIDGDFEPVNIVCQNFPQSDDWLKDLIIEVENVSGKPIDYLEFVTMVCDLKNVEYCVAIPLIYGRVESKKITLEDINSGKRLGNIANKPKSTQAPAQPIPAGGKVKLAISESAYNSAKQSIEKIVSINTLHSADLLLGQTHHPDGSAWFNESMLANGSLGKYKNDSNSYLVPKQSYVWGYIRENRQSYVADIYAGPATQEDDSGVKSRIQGHDKKIRTPKRMVVFSSGGG